MSSGQSQKRRITEASAHECCYNQPSSNPSPVDGGNTTTLVVLSFGMWPNDLQMRKSSLWPRRKNRPDRPPWRTQKPVKNQHIRSTACPSNEASSKDLYPCVRLPTWKCLWRNEPYFETHAATRWYASRVKGVPGSRQPTNHLQHTCMCVSALTHSHLLPHNHTLLTNPHVQ
jgi:hypothetical protein